jgi:peptide/nickel transport system permease protein
MSFALIVLTAIPLGIWQAKHAGKLRDHTATVLSQVLMSIPPFFLGIIITLVCGILLKLFTPGDYVSYKDSVGGFIRYLIFPAIAIAIPKSAMTAKMLRSSIMGQVDEDYVRTAYSRGNSSMSVMWRHVLRNAMIPVITFLAMTIADIVAGSIVVEQVFSIPGIGRLLLTSIANRDYPVVQAIIVIMAFIVVTVNFLVDIIYQFVDPRIRLK